MKILLSVLLLNICLGLKAQNTMNETLPYSIIAETPENYTPGTVVARMIDGLGFRYHWATADLADTELDYAPGNDGRTIHETLLHIYGLSEVILNSAKKTVTDRTSESPEMTFEVTRKITLENFKTASELFIATKDLGEHSVIFKTANGESEFPFWNNINGPIEDAVWHTGQVIVLRRSAGNPINPKVNVFLGRLND